LDEADDMLRQSLALHRALGDQMRSANDLMWQSQVAWYRGDLDATDDLAAEAITTVDPDAATAWVATAWTMRAIAATRRGSPDARHRLEVALHQHQRASFSRGIVWTTQLIADLDHEEGKIPDAARRHQQSLALARATRNQWALFEEFAALAQLAADGGLPREAAHLMGAAQTLSATSGVLPRTGRRRYEQTTERVTALIGADEFAHELAVGRSLATAAAAEEAAQTVTLLLSDSSSPRPQSAALAAGPLSARELEVLRLVAVGQTDQEIAAALFISHATARTHTRNILAKLDVSSRAAAVAYGLHNGLI
jgi:DNA-binding CsgD family transcriptional regulator